MPRVLHRISPNRARELRERVWALVEARLRGVICGRCGCTYATQDEKCTADLGASCPGSEAIERVKAGAEREVGLAS